ncbi:molybdenum cofactor guanylyltransferase [Paenibacillus sinopodophylli]|uniref:molybdenum cofactor guanylyltransferase n=1 Tax=Paenibacillus sinopodophylli TaxID=1837342 RepID=UPI00110C9819|nr:molybdenum cofactor guanylyltransferase [Paenibacillus sinopodophylli]
MKKPHIQGLLLAGGQSSRMGTDKALLDIGGKSLIYRLAKQMAGLTEHVTVSIGHTEREGVYRESLGELADAVSYVSDRYPGCGPLSGLHAGLSAIGEGYVFVMACDMPLLSEELLAELLQKLEHEADVIHVSGQPFHALYHARTASAISLSLAAGDFRLMGLLGKLKSVQVDPRETEFISPFINLNTPEEYNKYIAHNS